MRTVFDILNRKESDASKKKITAGNESDRVRGYLVSDLIFLKVFHNNENGVK